MKEPRRRCTEGRAPSQAGFHTSLTQGDCAANDSVGALVPVISGAGAQPDSGRTPSSQDRSETRASPVLGELDLGDRAHPSAVLPFWGPRDKLGHLPGF